MPPPIIEITSATACSGKTQFLYYLVSLSLLPAKHNDVQIQGKEAAVVLLDLSGKFSILCLHDVMHYHIAKIHATEASSLTEEEMTSLITSSLIHLHVFRPHSTTSLLATLASIPSYLLAQPPVHLSTNRPLGLLAINDLSAFLWQDRLSSSELEPTIAPNPYAEKANPTPLLNDYRKLVSSLRSIQYRFSCTILATNWGLSPVTIVSGGHRALRPHLPSPWNTFCTVKVIVERDRVSKFGPGMSAQEALEEGEKRWEAVEKSGFSGWLNLWEAESWREEVREGLRGLAGGGSFDFRVTDKGVVVGQADG